MNVRKADYFIADIERRSEWYITHAGREVAERYLEAVEASRALLGKHPRIGPCGGFEHPGLRGWRFFLVVRPFRKHRLFYVSPHAVRKAENPPAITEEQYHQYYDWPAAETALSCVCGFVP